MPCVSIVSYLLLLNRSPTSSFTPFRGLQQSNPLSPYLFFLCVEGLSSLIRHAGAHDVNYMALSYQIQLHQLVIYSLLMIVCFLEESQFK